MKKIILSEKDICMTEPPFFIAELGICHGGDLKTALELTKLSAEAGADCIKSETFQRETIALDPSAVTSYKIRGTKLTVPLSEHMDKYQLTFDEHHEIKKLCDEIGLPFISTAHDTRSVDFLVDIGSAGIKVASADIVNYPLLKYIAKKGLPIFIDTGGAFQYEIEIAVLLLKKHGQKDIIINHNPSGHPALPQHHDLKVIPRLKKIFSLPIGLSDHYDGYEMLYAATAIGASVLEKPVSMDRFVPEPERNWSISINELKLVIQNCKNVYKALGSEERVMTEDAVQYRDQNRPACAAAINMKKGEVLRLESVVFGRPRKGIPVENWHLAEGRRLKVDKHKFDFITWQDLD